MAHRVVIVGGGFGGFVRRESAPKLLTSTSRLVDRRNFHLFQPLLYQVLRASCRLPTSPFHYAQFSAGKRTLECCWPKRSILIRMRDTSF